MSELKGQPKPKTGSAIVAPGASGTIFEIPNSETMDRDVYLIGLGTGIDPTSNSAYAIQRLLVNGSPHSDYGAITSQLGSLSSPADFSKSPFFLGRSCSVSMKGEMLAGASGNTTMDATILLLLTKPGERP